MNLSLFHLYSGTNVKVERALVTFMAKVKRVVRNNFLGTQLPNHSLFFLPNHALSMQLGMAIKFTMLAEHR